MNIGLDYDDTYTRDPAMWNEMIQFMRMNDNKVYIVTWRDENEVSEIRQSELQWLVNGIYPTNRKAKQPFMFAQGICIDVWIDDNPRACVQDMEKL